MRGDAPVEPDPVEARLDGALPRDRCYEPPFDPPRMTPYVQLIVVNIVLAILFTTTVLGAPLEQAILGAAVAGAMLYSRYRRRRSRRSR